MHTAIIVGLSVLLAGSVPSTMTYNAPISPVEARITQYASNDVERVIEEVFGPDAPLMKRVAHCESSMRQFDRNGVVISNPITADRGIFQVNVEYHGDAAKKAGLNIYTLEGNVAYAKVLFDQSGVQPWSASRNCWSKVDL